MRKTALQKSPKLVFPKCGTRELNMFTTLAYIVANILANGERGCAGDDDLAGLCESQKQYISDLLFPTTVKKQ